MFQNEGLLQHTDLTCSVRLIYCSKDILCGLAFQPIKYLQRFHNNCVEHVSMSRSGREHECSTCLTSSRPEHMSSFIYGSCNISQLTKHDAVQTNQNSQSNYFYKNILTNRKFLTSTDTLFVFTKKCHNLRPIA